MIKYLEEKGFKFDIIEDPSDYTVKISVGVDIGRKNYVSMLKNSIDHGRKGMDMVFIMKDLASVEEAIMEGAEKLAMAKCNPIVEGEGEQRWVRSKVKVARDGGVWSEGLPPV
ncbi:MAG: hypothetical protein MASP_01523 [Candidatus Methanolliviera sp. GoM_asphalt]|nr:MAG: hypothetical protein MASP_01523 [Candidatus Methanolliviera sp. GoM_asphalt]